MDSDFGLKFYVVIVAFFLDTVLYFVAAWYISSVFPGDYGVPQRFYFFLTSQYWCGRRPTLPLTISDSDEEPGSSSADIQTTSSAMDVAIRIVHLSKVYDNNTKALDNLTVSFYENQITGFLGHNGAGKTTTM